MKVFLRTVFKQPKIDFPCSTVNAGDESYFTVAIKMSNLSSLGFLLVGYKLSDQSL